MCVYGHGSIPMVPYLGGLTSIYHLFWYSLGYHGFDPWPFGYTVDSLWRRRVPRIFSRIVGLSTTLWFCCKVPPVWVGIWNGLEAMGYSCAWWVANKTKLETYLAFGWFGSPDHDAFNFALWPLPEKCWDSNSGDASHAGRALSEFNEWLLNHNW